jgi:hypothetical protein
MGRRNEKARRAPGHGTARKRRPTNERRQSARERVKLIMHGGRASRSRPRSSSVRDLRHDGGRRLPRPQPAGPKARRARARTKRLIKDDGGKPACTPEMSRHQVLLLHLATPTQRVRAVPADSTGKRGSLSKTAAALSASSEHVHRLANMTVSLHRRNRVAVGVIVSIPCQSIG